MMRDPLFALNRLLDLSFFVDMTFVQLNLEYWDNQRMQQIRYASAYPPPPPPQSGPRPRTSHALEGALAPFASADASLLSTSCWLLRRWLLRAGSCGAGSCGAGSCGAVHADLTARLVCGAAGATARS